MQPLALTALAALLLCADPAPEQKPDEKDATKPVLIVKHKDFLVHAIPQPPRGELKFLPVEARPLLLLVYTSLPSGEMKRLAACTDVFDHPPMGGLAIQRTSTRIVGVAADSDRLYMVSHTAITARVRPAGAGPESQKNELLVFRLSDGEKLHTLEMKEGDFPDTEPANSAEPGPLKVVDGGVTCYGVTFTFKGKDVTQRYDRKKD